MDEAPPGGRGKGNRAKASCGATGGAVYGLGFIGAAVYYIQVSSSFWGGALGFLKALVWPAFLVYEALRSLGA